MRVDLYPVYRVYIHLNKFCNIDLTSRGYYQVCRPFSWFQVAFQIRLTPKNTNEYNSLDIKLYDKGLSVTTCTLLPSTILNGVAISKAFEVLYADEITELGECSVYFFYIPFTDDTFSISLQLVPESNFKSLHKVQLDLELWLVCIDSIQ